jgi:xylulokinase
MHEGKGMEYFIGLDIGTSSVKAMLISETNIEKVISADYPISFPQNGWAEQNPNDWYNATVRLLRKLAKSVPRGSIKSISFSGQMHGLVMLDNNDSVIRPAILWNDGRSAKETDYLNNEIGKEFLLKHTGNIAFAGFTAPKLLWVYNNEPENFKRISKIMLPKDYVAYRLSGNYATDVSDAAGTLYFDTENRRWSEEMLKLLHINNNMLPQVYESDEISGTLCVAAAEETGLGTEVKIIIGAGDNAASAIGTGTVNSGDCNISLGTSGTVFVCSDSFKSDNKNAIHSFCSANHKYHYLACTLTAASSQKWWVEEILKTEYRFIESLEIQKNDVLFLPYLMGERSPINDSKVRGAFYGLSLDTSREQMTLAVLEGVAFSLKQNLDIIRSNGVNVKRSKVCGGGAKSRKWLEILASVLDIEIEIPVYEHGGSLGAAMLAAKAVLDEKSYSKLEKRFYTIKENIVPNNSLKNYYGDKYIKYLKLYPIIKVMEQ